MSIVAVPVVRVQDSDAQHHVKSGCRLGQIHREQRDIVLIGGRIRERDDLGKQGVEQGGSAAPLRIAVTSRSCPNIPPGP